MHYLTGTWQNINNKQCRRITQNGRRVTISYFDSGNITYGQIVDDAQIIEGGCIGYIISDNRIDWS
jgi:hypothetical protein